MSEQLKVAEETSSITKSPDSGTNTTISSGTASANYVGLIVMAVFVCLLETSNVNDKINHSTLCN